MSLIRQFILQDPNDDTRLAKFDPIFEIPITVDVAHYEVHEGDAFETQFADITMGNNDTIILAFKTAAGTKRVHLISDFNTLVGGEFILWESPTWTTNTGVLNAILNHKREASMNSSTLLEDLTATPAFTATDNVLSNVTGLNTGAATAIITEYAFGVKNKINAGASRGVTEWILKPDTQYAAVFTSSGASNKAQITLDWYEHTDS